MAQQTDQLDVGSIADVAAKDGASIAETFIGCDAVVIFDVSGSMCTPDSRGGQRRYDVGVQELAALQQKLPGKVAVNAFSDGPLFVPGGVPPFLAGSTDLAKALLFAKVADVASGDMRFFVISDGEPDDRQEALAVAQTYRNRIDTVFVGPERNPQGRDFLAQLAAASGGRNVTADRVKNLAATTQQLLLT